MNSLNNSVWTGTGIALGIVGSIPHTVTLTFTHVIDDGYKVDLTWSLVDPISGLPLTGSEQLTGFLSMHEPNPFVKIQSTGGRPDAVASTTLNLLSYNKMEYRYSEVIPGSPEMSFTVYTLLQRQ